MLSLDEGTFLLRIARRAFFQHLGEKLDKDSLQSESSRLQERMGAYVRVGVLKRQQNHSGLILGFTGYPMPQKTVIKSVRDASIAIASANPKIRLDGNKIWFEVTILSPPQSLNGIPPVKLPSAIEFGRDAVMVASSLAKAIILPQTAIEKCQDTFSLLAECCMAAGLLADAWISSSNVDLFRFRTQVFREKEDHKEVTEIALPEKFKLDRDQMKQ